MLRVVTGMRATFGRSILTQAPIPQAIITSIGNNGSDRLPRFRLTPTDSSASASTGTIPAVSPRTSTIILWHPSTSRWPTTFPSAWPAWVGYGFTTTEGDFSTLIVVLRTPGLGMSTIWPSESLERSTDRRAHFHG